MVFVIFAVYFKKMLNNRAKSILHFHFIVFIFGFTSILGVLIEKEAIALVWYRMLIASVFLTLFIFFFNKKKFELSYNLLYKLVAAGFLIAAHWVSFFYAIKMVGVSPTLAMLSSGALMTAILEPVFYKRKILFYEVLFGGITMIGMFVIFKTSPDDWLGMLVALIATVLGVLFTLINGLLIKENSSVIITLGEMITGVGFISLFLLFGGGFDVSFYHHHFRFFIFNASGNSVYCICNYFFYRSDETVESIYNHADH